MKVLFTYWEYTYIVIIDYFQEVYYEKIVSFVFFVALFLSLTSPAFASTSHNYVNLSELASLQANNPDNIRAVLEDGLTVSDSSPTARHYFEDGSYIELSIYVPQTSNEQKSNLRVQTTSTRTASVSLSGKSTVTGDTLVMWTYTLYQDYQSNGTRITWYEDSPYSSFDSPFYSAWTLDSETVSTGNNPDDSNGIRATSSIKCSFGIWEIRPQSVSAKLTLDIEGDGSYTGYTTWL